MKKLNTTVIFALIVFLSGIAGLSYELLWIRSIKGYFGNEIFSISIVITLFFTGLGLGGIAGSRLLKREWSPFKIYLIIEALIGLFGLSFPYLIHIAQESYLAMSVYTSPGYWILLKAVHIILLLIIPTTLIGITLPIIAAIAVYKPEVFTSRFSLFYGLNTFGAVIGSIICGLILIPSIGLAWTGRIIALINFTVAFMCWWNQDKFIGVPKSIIFKEQKWNEALFPCLIAFFMGFLALSYEIVWIRIFSFNFLTTTISLAILLSMFLIGLALGSLILSFWKRPVSIIQLGFLEFAKAILIVISFFLIRKIFFKDWVTLFYANGSNDIWHLIKYYLIFGSFVFLIPGLIMGITFPLIERIWPSAKAGTGHVVGIITAWNTWGGAIGSLLAGLVLISLIGTTNTLIVSITVSIAISLVLFIYGKKYYLIPVPLIVAVLVIGFLPREMNWQRTSENIGNYEFYKEGRMGSVAVIKSRFGNLTLNIDNSYVLGGTSIKAIRVQEHQGALPIILKPSPGKKVLKIGEGTGITSFLSIENSGVSQLDIIEIVPEVIDALHYFSYDNHRIWLNPKVKIFKGDGREFLALSSQKYDIIIGELYTPQISGAGNLYSKEHFQNVKNHMAADGLFCQWLQLGQFSREMFQIVVNTFVEVFGEGSLWLVNNNFELPAVGLVYYPYKSWDENTLQRGLNQYSDSLKKSMGWITPEDISVSFITNNLKEIASGEQRINSIDHPWVEEIAARTYIFNQESPVYWFMNKRSWPDIWSNWQQGFSIWEKSWDMMNSLIVVSGTKEIDNNFLHLMNLIDSIPNVPILNRYKADAINTVVEEILMKQKLYENPKDQYKYIANLYSKAISLDPYNYNFRYNMIYLYQMLGEKKKMHDEFEQLWQILPEHLKSEKVYSELKNQMN
jgi:spermidine synthase